MYIEECIARDRYDERLKQARQERTARQLLRLSRLEKQRARAERELLRAWRRADQLRSSLGSAG